MIRRNIKNIKALEKLEKKERLLKKKTDANTITTFKPTGANSSSISGDWIFLFFLLRNLNIAQ